MRARIDDDMVSQQGKKIGSNFEVHFLITGRSILMIQYFWQYSNHQLTGLYCPALSGPFITFNIKGIRSEK